ncbi:hypothetical protein C8E86_5614 [Catellatospora citrea]|nr:hypothetical protein C8E86_5614 [Catellatospora citrea]
MAAYVYRPRRGGKAFAMVMSGLTVVTIVGSSSSTPAARPSPRYGRGFIPTTAGLLLYGTCVAVRKPAGVSVPASGWRPRFGSS